MRSGGSASPASSGIQQALSSCSCFDFSGWLTTNLNFPSTLQLWNGVGLIAPSPVIPVFLGGESRPSWGIPLGWIHIMAACSGLSLPEGAASSELHPAHTWAGGAEPFLNHSTCVRPIELFPPCGWAWKVTRLTTVGRHGKT